MAPERYRRRVGGLLRRAHKLTIIPIVEIIEVLISVEMQRVAEKKAETQKKIAITEAEKNAYVSNIVMEQKLMEKDSLRKQEEISNAMTMKEAEANRLKLTPEFLELRFIEAISNNTKIFFGNKIPNMVLDQRLLGNFLKELGSIGCDVVTLIDA
ncbi:erlin-2-B [Tanacetum coccineum]